MRLLERFKAHLWELFEIGVIGCASFDQMSNILHDQCDTLELNQKLTPKTLFSLESLAPILRDRALPYQISGWLSLFANCLERCSSTLALRFSSIASRVLLSEIHRTYDINLGYLLLLEEIMEECHHGVKFSEDAEINTELIEAMLCNLNDAKEKLASVRSQFPQLTTCINTLKASRRVLNAGIRFVDTVKHHGGLAETEADRLSALLKERGCAVFFDSGKALEFLTRKVDVSAQVHPEPDLSNRDRASPGPEESIDPLSGAMDHTASRRSSSPDADKLERQRRWASAAAEATQGSSRRVSCRRSCAATSESDLVQLHKADRQRRITLSAEMGSQDSGSQDSGLEDNRRRMSFFRGSESKADRRRRSGSPTMTLAADATATCSLTTTDAE